MMSSDYWFHDDVISIVFVVMSSLLGLRDYSPFLALLTGMYVHTDLVADMLLPWPWCSAGVLGESGTG